MHTRTNLVRRGMCTLFLFNSIILLFCWHVLQIFEPGQKSLQTFPRLQRASQGQGSQQDPVYKSSLPRHILRASANHQPWVWVGAKTSFRSVCWLPPQSEGSFFRIDYRVHKIVPLMQNCFYFLRVMKASNKQTNNQKTSWNILATGQSRNFFYSQNHRK